LGDDYSGALRKNINTPSETAESSFLEEHAFQLWHLCSLRKLDSPIPLVVRLLLLQSSISMPISLDHQFSRLSTSGLLI
jgi:hypothetical protein